MSSIISDKISDQAERLYTPTPWTVVHAPGAAAQAIATKSAGAAGVKHVCHGIIATIAAGATAQTPINVQVLDGAAVLFSAAVSAPANGQGGIFLTGINLVGTAATSMTLQFSAAGAAATVENVTNDQFRLCSPVR
jgi:hypothetical protein